MARQKLIKAGSVKKVAGNVLQNIKGAFNVYQHVRSPFLYNRFKYSPAAQEILRTQGNKRVRSVSLHRNVLSSVYTNIISAWTFGETARRLSMEDKDKLYHISMWVTLEDGTVVNVEKTALPNFTLNPSKPIEEETQDGPAPPPGLTLNTMLERARKRMGDTKFFSYSAKDNNCGNFIEAILSANGINNGNTHAFIGQDTKKILAGFPSLRRFMNSVTDVAARAETAYLGGRLAHKKHHRKHY